MNNILAQICNDKKETVEIQRKRITENELYSIIEDLEKPTFLHYDLKISLFNAHFLV